MRNPANVKGTDLSSSYFPAPAYNGANIEVSTSPYCDILNQKSDDDVQNGNLFIVAINTDIQTYKELDNRTFDVWQTTGQPKRIQPDNSQPKSQATRQQKTGQLDKKTKGQKDKRTEGQKDKRKKGLKDKMTKRKNGKSQKYKKTRRQKDKKAKR